MARGLRHRRAGTAPHRARQPPFRRADSSQPTVRRNRRRGNSQYHTTSRCSRTRDELLHRAVKVSHPDVPRRRRSTPVTEPCAMCAGAIFGAVSAARLRTEAVIGSAHSCPGFRRRCWCRARGTCWPEPAGRFRSWARCWNRRPRRSFTIFASDGIESQIGAVPRPADIITHRQRSVCRVDQSRPRESL